MTIDRAALLTTAVPEIIDFEHWYEGVGTIRVSGEGRRILIKVNGQIIWHSDSAASGPAR